MRIILAIEAIAVGQRVEIQVIFVVDIAMSSITRYGSLIVATPIRNLATTAAVAWPFTVALQGLVLARILHLEGILLSPGTALAPRKAVGIERQSGDGCLERAEADSDRWRAQAGVCRITEGKLTFCLRR